MKENASKIDNSVIRIGIDLGTTNSEIAVNRNGEVEIIKNLLGDDYTPSVFGIDKAGNKVVGKKAYDKLFKGTSPSELDNNKAEVKRLMGTNEKIRFSRLNISMTPEEVSAEILKSLKSDLTREYPDFPTVAAVITVPAYFDSLQNEATKRAGKLAGFKHIVLLQEPIAAAMAYGFSADKDQSWIVYDLGGGTFDVALVSAKNGILKVIEHGGDNFLGGKDIDQRLVDKVIKPAILRNFTLADFDQNNDKHRGVFAKLKSIAETAKIELSSYDKVTIEIDEIGNDDNGKEIYTSIDYTRAEFNNLIRPIVDKTIDVTKNVIKQSQISKASISRIVFVGGPTQIPYIRQRVEKDLGIEIDTSVDPLTTVARGACIYGLSERVPVELMKNTNEAKNAAKLILNYDSMTSDDDQLVTGTISNLPDSSQYYIRISSDNGFYSSNNIRIKNGKFFDTIAVERKKTNTYRIYLSDESGNNIPVFPDSFTVTHGLSVQGAPIPHDIGVIYTKRSLESNQMIEVCDKYFERGLTLPLEATRSYKTVRTLSKNASTPLPIKVYEGDSSDPNYNEIITTLKINGDKLDYDLPAGSDIDITIKINESREVSVDAYLPDVDLLLNARADTYAQSIDTGHLQKSLDEQKERAEKLMDSVSAEEKQRIEENISSIQDNIDKTNDTDSQQKAERDLNSLSQHLDKVEDSGSSVGLIDDIHRTIHSIEEMLTGIEGSSDNYDNLSQELEGIKKDLSSVVSSREDSSALSHILNQAKKLQLRTTMEIPAFWVAMLRNIENDQDAIADQQLANYHISRAHQAIINNDPDGLRLHVQELLQLMPVEAQEKINSNLAGITK